MVRGELRRDGRSIPLRRKSWELLRYLAQHPGILMPFDTLLDAVWPGIAVTPRVLTNVVGELRKALCDESRSPRVIETVHRRGYRFIAEVTTGAAGGAATGASAPADAIITETTTGAVAADPGIVRGDSTAHAAFAAPPAIFVGRDTELEILHAAWRTALQGHRQTVFLTGEPGIGKTGLLDMLVHQLKTDRGSVPFLSGRGQSVEKFGSHEPFRPILEVFQVLASDVDRVIDLLRRYAPSWLVQIPWLLPSAEIGALRESLTGIGAGRMLREGAVFLEALSQEVPLLLVLEDMHWSDPATMDFVSVIAQRRTPARILTIATHRAAVLASEERSIVSIARALAHRRHASTLMLGRLPPAAVETFLARRFESSSLASKLGAVIERHTFGSPLLLMGTTEQLVQHGWVQHVGGQWVLTTDLETVDFALPDHVREIVAAQMSSLPEEQLEVLEAASVVGLEFTTQAVAAAVGRDDESVERACEQLARRGRFLRLTGLSTWPDGTLGESYAFNHALYQRALYDAVAPLRRSRLHLRIAERLEKAYGDRVDEVASEVAAAYVAARQPTDAARVLELAALSAARRFAYREAAEVLQAAIAELRKAADHPERNRHERRLQLQLGNALMAAMSLGDRRALDAFVRAEALCEATDASRALFRARLGQCMWHLMVGDIPKARALGERLVAIAASLPRAAVAAHTYMGAALMLAGELVEARGHLERATASDHEPGMLAFIDLNVFAANLFGLTLTRLGFLDQGRASVEAAVARSRAVGNPYDRTQALCFAAEVYLLQRDLTAAGAAADEAATLAVENGFVSLVSVTRIYQHALRDGQPEDIQQVLNDRSTLGEHWNESRFLAILAEQHLRRGAVDAASRRLDDALARVQAGERDHEAELYRLKGQVLLARAGVKPQAIRRSRQSVRTSSSGDLSEAESWFRRGLDVARSQQAKLFELRSALGLGGLLAATGDTGSARAVVGDALGWFREGLHAPDLAEARAFLERSGQASLS